MKKFFASCAACIIISFSSLSHAQDTKVIPPSKPRIVVGIVVSQMRYDYIQRYWDKLDPDGIKLMVDRGSNCINTSFNYLFSQQGVGHATIATGTTPSEHGIVGREWYLFLQDRIESNIEDPAQSAVGTNVDFGRFSPRNLFSTTYADELRLSNNFLSKVYSVSLNPEAGILSSGHTANAAFWGDEQTGNGFNTYYFQSLPHGLTFSMQTKYLMCTCRRRE